MPLPSPRASRLLALLAIAPLSACAADTAAPAAPASEKVAEAPRAPAETKPAEQTKTDAAPAKTEPVATPAQGAAQPQATATGDTVPAKPQPPAEDPAKREARLKIDRMALEKARLDLELEITALKTRRARSAAETERARLDTEAALRTAKLALEFAEADELKADAERAIAVSNLKATLASFDAVAASRDADNDLKLRKLESDNALARIAADVSRHKREKEAARIIAAASRAYPAEPCVDGVLTISDRRIALNGAITDPVARRFIDRLAFYNLRDPKAPVFVVIDNCPGGSIMAGYQVIKAIESSKAPVHVVVKGTAESMAAAIVASAPRSYLFASSVLLHRQATGLAYGNTTMMREQRGQIEAFFQRINEPVARRMGISVEEFVKRMYEKNSGAEWIAFGDDAVKLNWADKLITRIVEDGVDDMVETPYGGAAVVFGEYKDASGRTRIELPPLAPGDAWMLHDPAGLYGTR